MEEGKWDLSLVDPEELKKSQATLVYGQMNEPPGARASVALSGLTVAEEFRDHGGKNGEAADIMFLLIISSGLLRLVQRCLLFLAVCLQP